MENGFTSPRADVFPAGLRVLVVDDDPTWLKILEKMLKKCSYEVTTCCLARDALNVLRERKDGFDIVISDVNMPDMDGFKLLEHVGLEMDLPVIMMSVDGETSRVMKGVQHGACDYLLKPVRMKELKNIWQHVFRKRIHEVKDNENYEGIEDIQMMRNGSDKFDDRHLIGVGDLCSAKKRKDMENREHEDQDSNDPSAMKKARVIWSVDLHQKFVKAVDQIGFDKAGPKKILDLMNVPWLTRENVASHLQKYRLYWSRLQKQNEPKTSYGGIKQQEFTSKDPATSFGLQSSVTMHQNNATSGSFGYSGSEVLVQDVGPGKHEGGLTGNISFLPVTEPRKALVGDCPDTQKTSNGTQMGFTHPFGSLGLDVNYTSLESVIPQHHTWSTEIPMMQQLMQQPKAEHHGYTHLPIPGPPHHMQADRPRPPQLINTETSITRNDKPRHSAAKPLCSEYRSNHVRNASPIEQTIESFSTQTETQIVNHILDQNNASNWESDQQNLIPGNGLALQSSHEDLKFCLLQDYEYFENFGPNSIEILEYNDPELFNELSHSYDRVRFNSDYLCDAMELPITDQGLFIV